jgi:hypothetical protein
LKKQGLIMKLKAISLHHASCAALVLITSALTLTPRPAAAFGLGDFSGLVDSVSPLLGGVMTFDITPYTTIVSNTTNFVSSIQKGDYSGAVNSLTSTLGDYGIIDPAKLRDKSKIDIGNGVKVGFASGTDTREILASLNANKDISAQATMDGALGDEAQKDIIKRGEGTASLVDASAQYSKMSGQTKISQKILRNQSAQLGVLAGLEGQQLSEQRSQGVTLNLLTSISADIRAQGNQDSRVKDGAGDRDTKGVISSSAMFSSLMAGGK